MASRSVNVCHLMGRLGRDADQRFTPNGKSVCNFSIACDQRWKDKQTNEWKTTTDWINIVLWGQEKLSEYLKKGTQVYVTGRISSRSYDGNDGKKVYVTEVVAEDVILVGGAPEKREADEWSAPPRETGPRRTAAEGLGIVQPQRQATVAVSGSITDEDLPF